jgi:hypothetical protein
MKKRLEGHTTIKVNLLNFLQTPNNTKFSILNESGYFSKKRLYVVGVFTEWKGAS